MAMERGKRVRVHWGWGRRRLDGWAGAGDGAAKVSTT